MREAAEDIVARAPACKGEFAFSDSRIRLRSGDPENAGIFDLTTSALPPGFSKDGRTAIVLLSIPWSIHGANGTYVLTLENGAWRVRVRDFVRYM